ncbi:hypothetical protein M3231_02250 [Neobacillus mesonae]|nr:hypothetical protein [Neobacillus mesonae]
MKLGVFLLAVVLLIVIGLFVVFAFLDDDPPQPKIRVDGKEVTSVRGSYCWEGKFRSLCAESITPPDLMKHHELQPTVVQPEAKLFIEFEQEPLDGSMGVNQWSDNHNAVDIPLNYNMIAVPKQKGIYIYDVYAHWNNGSSSYAFSVKVE